MFNSCWCDCLAQTFSEEEKPRGKGEDQGLHQCAARLVKPLTQCHWSKAQCQQLELVVLFLQPYQGLHRERQLWAGEEGAL